MTLTPAPVDTDPFSSGFQRCPFEGLAELRLSDPVHQVDDLPLYMVTRYEDCVAVLRDPKRFSNSLKDCGAVLAAVGFIPSDDDVAAILKEGPTPVDALIKTDPPRHTRHRQLVNRWFTNRAVEQRWLPTIERITDELISSFDARGRADLVPEFAVPLPVQVIAETLGIPQERFQDFRRWSVAKDSNFGKRKTHDEWVESAKAARDMRLFIAQESAARVESPRDDLIGSLVAASLEETADASVGDPLTLEQVNEITEELLVAGNVTTTQLISETINQLIDHPDRLEAVRRNAAEVTDVIEEVLRLAGPVMGLFRRSTEETFIGDTVVPANALLMIYYGSASHDQAMFEDPFEFRPGRENGNRHLGFGHGLHLCVGAPLARAEARFAVPQLLSRLPNLRRGGGQPGRYQENFLTRRLVTLPLAWDTGGVGATALPG